jgi:hypothetical protein
MPFRAQAGKLLCIIALFPKMRWQLACTVPMNEAKPNRYANGFLGRDRTYRLHLPDVSIRHADRLAFQVHHIDSLGTQEANNQA